MCRHFGHLMLAIALTGTLAAGQQRPQPPARTAPTPPQPRREPLTDRDVIQMVESGKPEAAILATIRSSRTNFDLSTQGCRLMAAAHVSRTILNAMSDPSRPPCASTSESSKLQTSGAGALLGNGNATLLGDGSKQTPPGVSRALNPQPLAPRTAANGSAGSPGANIAQATAAVSDYRQPPGNKQSSRTHALRPVKLAPAKALRKATNSLLAKQNAGIIAILQQQRQAAGQEASAMKLGIRSPASAGATTVSAQKAAPSTLLHANAGVSQVGAESTQGATGPSGFQIVDKHYAEPVSIACAKDSTPRILSAPSVFTPEAKFNLFTISGCGFGPTAAANTAYIFGGNGFRENLVIDFWSDRGITAHLDPALAGVLDRNNITLVVAPASRQPMEKSGFKFYAARGMPAPDGSDQEVPLAYNSIAQSDVALFGMDKVISGFDQLPSNAASNFPSFSFRGTPVAGWVFRYASGYTDPVGGSAECFVNEIGYQDKSICGAFYFLGDTSTGWQLKSDQWDFSKLAPGFSVSSYGLYTSTLDPASLCHAWDQWGDPLGRHDGNWDFNLDSQGRISVTWPVYACWNGEYTGRQIHAVQSSYGLAVWVLGPRCIDPWTGQKDQSCMNKVRQTLN